MALHHERRGLLVGAGALALGWRALGGVGAVVGAVAAPAPRVIEIVAKKFEFVPAQVEARLGETLLLRFTAPEVAMGVHLADFKQRADVVPGQVATLHVTADKAGSFIFVCDVFCGSGHEDMSGVLLVTG